MSQQDGRLSLVIRVRLRHLFFSEKHKGRLINDLLLRHYEEKEEDSLKPKGKRASWIHGRKG